MDYSFSTTDVFGESYLLFDYYGQNTFCDSIELNNWKNASSHAANHRNFALDISSVF